MAPGDATNRESAGSKFLQPPSKASGLLHPETTTTGLSSVHQRRLYRQSAHLRPAQLLELQNAIPASPSVTDDAPGVQLSSSSSSSPDMSLFNLFSKPKVERAHGYAEPGLAPPSSSLFTRHANGSRPELLVRVQTKDGAADVPSRAPSSMSFFNTATKPSSTPKAPDPPRATPPPPRKGPFEPPPLFQAWPQSMKHSLLEVSSMTAETVLQKSKVRKMGSSQPISVDLSQQDRVDDGSSVDTRRTARTTMRHVAHGSFTHVDLPKKIVVLVTSGFLLQYSESGPSDRLPEKILQLGKESAAFACDLIPGKHYVLQISATVDQQGVVVANSNSIFSKLGLRNSANKRVAKNILLVLPNAAEMDAWMVAIRREIESLGGSSARSDMAVRPKTRDAVGSYGEMKSTPGLSHRYQQKPEAIKAAAPGQGPMTMADDLTPPPRTKDEDEEADIASLDEIEEDAAKLDDNEKPLPTPRAETDGHSVGGSSIAVSVDQQRLNSLQSSHRASHTTVATTVGSSRNNSISESLRSDQAAKESSDAGRDPAQTRSAYRTLTSYAASRRRSAMPAPREPLPTLDVPPPIQPFATTSTPVESPVIGRNSELPALPLSPRAIGVAISEPNLRAVAADTKAKHDSKLPSPPFLSAGKERPESFVGDLPSPSVWASERSPSKRVSTLGAMGASSGYQRSNTSRRQSTQPFSLPLKINPSTPANRPPSRHEVQSSFNKLDAAGEEPTVHTLTAKVDAGKLLSILPIQQSPASPKPDVPSKHPARSASGRLSLFPTPLPPPSSPSPTSIPLTPTTETLERSPSATVLSTQSQAQANGYALRRPISMQVRSDPAPFLKSVRTSAYQQSPSTMQQQFRSFTAPIRSLKPSRSSVYLNNSQPTTAERTTTSTSTSRPPSSAYPLPSPEEEAADRPMPLPDRSSSPLPTSRPPSRASGRRMKTRSSLPELDLQSLGPPTAPPPQAPLPAPPPMSRPSSPLPPSMPAKTSGLGIKV